MRVLPAPIAAMLLLSSAPASAQTIDAATPLRVGAFLWDAPATSGGAEGLSITIGIEDQRLYVHRNDRLIGMSTVSTGARGRETPTGDFTILQKNRWHRSNLYSNAPMPFMQRLTWTGIAIHAGPLPGYPASHGCIRLPAAFARRLFTITSLGVPVAIVDRLHGAPLVTLRFADLDWMALDDDMLSVPAAAPAPATHWASSDILEAVRSGRLKPRLEYRGLPE